MRAEGIRGHRTNRQTSDDPGLLVIEQRENFSMTFGHQKRTPPKFGASILKSLDQFGHGYE